MRAEFDADTDFFATLLFVLCSTGLQAATLYVTPDESSGWTGAYTDLQNAIDAAESGDEIWVAAGTYTPSSQPTEVDNRGVSDLYNRGVSDLDN